MMSIHAFITHQPDTKPNPNPNFPTKQHAIENTQRNIIARPTYSKKLKRGIVTAPFYNCGL